MQYEKTQAHWSVQASFSTPILEVYYIICADDLICFTCVQTKHVHSIVESNRLCQM